MVGMLIWMICANDLELGQCAMHTTRHNSSQPNIVFDWKLFCICFYTHTNFHWQRLMVKHAYIWLVPALFNFFMMGMLFTMISNLDNVQFTQPAIIPANPILYSTENFYAFTSCSLFIHADNITLLSKQQRNNNENPKAGGKTWPYIDCVCGQKTFQFI